MHEVQLYCVYQLAAHNILELITFDATQQLNGKLTQYQDAQLFNILELCIYIC
jgi:hypothetical protein